MDKNKYYIYAHKRADNGNVFYIGKGCDKRAYIKSNRSEYWKRIVEKYGYEVIFLKTNLSEIEAYNFEISFIASYKINGECCANFTIGGDGVRVEKRWWNDKISKALTGKKTPKGELNKSYKDIISKEQLFDLYVNQKKNSIEIGLMFGVSYTTITTRLQNFNITARKCGKVAKKIICIEDSKEFDSIMDASKYYNLYRENIRKVLKGIYKHTGNKTFKYL